MNKSSHPPRSSSPAGPCPPDEIDMVTPANHLDFSIILPLFPNITEIRLCFQVDKAEKQSIAMTHCRCIKYTGQRLTFNICVQVKKCGIDFRWNMFGMTEKVRKTIILIHQTS